MASRKGLALLLAVGLLLPCQALAQPQRPSPAPQQKATLLIHVTHGPEHPTRAALAFLVARTAVEEGHQVRIFLAGDAVQLIRDPVLDSLAGIGTGRLREHYDVLAKAGVRFYLSGMSSRARGVTDADIKGKTAEFATPGVLLRLSLESDRMFVY
jgi:uncharacterized protein